VTHWKDRQKRGDRVVAEQEAVASPIEVKTTGHFVALLDRLKLSLALSVKPNHIIFLGALDGALTIEATRVAQPMGLAATHERLAFASARSIVVLVNASRLAAGYPGKPDYYDAYFIPRRMHFTGECLMHDMVFAGNAIIGANTNFSCICRIDDRFSFTPLWRPSFVSELRPQDRCHLNGFAGQDGKLRYVTTLAGTDTKQGWREQPDFTGMLIDTEKNRVLRDDLCLPHSPRLAQDELYLLNSGKGEVHRIDRESGASTVLATLPGFTHGLCEHAGVLFVGLSQNRTTRKDTPPPVAQGTAALICGVVAMEAATGRQIGMAEFTTAITEVYDIQKLPGIRRAGMHNLLMDDGVIGIDTPDSVFWMKREGKDDAHLFDAQASGNYTIRVS
jgi:uncharacterized protein (TIGR03032 family)